MRRRHLVQADVVLPGAATGVPPLGKPDAVEMNEADVFPVAMKKRAGIDALKNQMPDVHADRQAEGFDEGRRPRKWIIEGLDGKQLTPDACFEKIAKPLCRGRLPAFNPGRIRRIPFKGQMKRVR